MRSQKMKVHEVYFIYLFISNYIIFKSVVAIVILWNINYGECVSNTNVSAGLFEVGTAGNI